MKRFFTLLLLVLAVTVKAQKGLVINEFSQGDQGAREYVELVVVGTRTCVDSVADLRNWIIDDNNGWYGGSGTGIATGHLRFKNIANWQAVPIGSVLLLYNSADKNTSITLADDPTDANNDNVYVIDVANTTYFEANTTSPASPSSPTFTYPSAGYTATAASNDWTARMGLANGGDAIITVAPSTLGSAFHSVVYGFTPGSTFQTPTILLGTVGSQQNAWLTNSSYTSSGSYSVGSVSTAGNETPGAANTVANAAWITSLRTTNLTNVTAVGNNATCTSTNGSITFSNLCPNKTYTLSYTLNGVTQTSSLIANASGVATLSNAFPNTYTNLVITGTNVTVNTLPTVTIGAAATPVITAGAGATPTSCGATNGTILIPGLSSNTSYSYSYTFNGATTTASATSGNTGTLTIPGLGAGNYTNITISTGGCTSNAVSVTMPVGPLTYTTTSTTNATQCSPANGSIAINGLPTSAPASYSYNFNGAPVTGNGNISAAGTLVINGLASGTYSNLIITATGCSTSSIGPFTLTGPSTPVINAPTPTGVSTCGAVNGSLTFTGLNSNTLYTYQYTFNAGPGVATGTATTNGSGSLIIGSLPSGTYSGISVSSNGCVSNSIAGPVTIANGPFPAVTVTTINPTSCATGATGSFTVNGLSSNTVYSASIATTIGGITTNTVQAQTSNTAGAATWTGFVAGATVSFTLSNSGCTSGTLSAGPFVSPAAPAAPTASSNSPVCAGGTINLTVTAVAGNVYSWTGPGGYTATGATPSINNAATTNAGSYSVTATNSTTQCVSPSTTVAVAVTPLPQTPVAASNSPVCSGSTLSLSATGATSSTYAWTGPGGFTSTVQNPTIAVATSANAGTYTVAASLNGCTSVSASTAVVITPQPAISAATGTNPSSCGGTNGSITVSGLPASTAVTITYTKNGVSQTVSGTSSVTGTFLITALGTGTYTGFTITAGGCTGAASGAVVSLANPSAPPAPTATSNGPICAGSTLNLNASSITGASYSWSGPNGFASTLQNPSITGTTTAASGTYTVTASVSGCTSPGGQTTVVVNAVPASPTAASNSPVCSGNALNLTASPVTGAAYSWTGPNGFTSTTPNPVLAAVTTAASGTYSVTSTANGCSSAAATTTVIVNVTPAISGATGTNPSSCAGNNGAVALTGLPANTTVAIAYTRNGVAQTTTLTTGATGTGTISGLTAASYGAFTVTINNCVSAPFAGPVVLSNPSAPATPTPAANTPICAGNNLSLTTPAVTSAAYAWTGPNGFTSTLQNPTITAATAAASGSYFLTVTVAGCTSAAGSVAVTVNPIPAAPTASSNSPVCAGNQLNLFASTIAGATYSWTGPNGFTSTQQNPVITSAQTAPTTAFNVSATVNGCTSPVTTIAVVINSAPSASGANSTNPAVCGSATGSITLTGLVAGISYTVQFQKGGVAQIPQTIIANTAGNVTISGLTAGSYSGFSLATAASCPGAFSGTVVLSDPTPPTTPVVTQNGPLCAGATLTLTASSTANATYSWTGPNGFASTQQSPSITNAQPAASGNYTVTANFNGCTSAATTVAVVVNPTPAAPVAGSNSPVCSANPLNLTATTVAGASYSWTGPNGFISAQQNPVISNPVAASSGTYTVNAVIGNCPSPAATIAVTVNTTPAAPVVTAQITYCQFAASTVLTATGTALKWYTAATGGTALTAAPTPSTQTTGTTFWYVSQTGTGGCEGARSSVTVTVTAKPANPTVTSPVLYCQGTSAAPLSAVGTGLLWYTTATGGIGSTTAPTPQTATAGSTSFYVSQTNSGCESDRATIVVTVAPTPGAPAVTTPVNYCLGAAATPLSATGNNLLWYATATGGVGSATAPTPQTSIAGSTTYYASQGSGSCESPRVAIVVTVFQSLTVPVVQSPITLCQNSGLQSLATYVSGSGLKWYTTATGGTASTTAPQINTATTTGSVTYYVSQSNASCEGPRTAVTATISPAPQAPVPQGPFSYCQNATAVSLNAAGSGILKWYTSATGGTAITNAPTPPTAIAGTQTYYVSQTIGNCESPRAVYTINIVQQPDTPQVNAPNYCQFGAPVTLTAVGQNLTWYTTPTGGTGTTTTPSVPFGASGIFTYYVTQTVNGCESKRAAAVIVVKPKPAPPAVSNPIVYCQYVASVPLVASGQNLKWYYSPVGGTGTATAPTPSTLYTGTQTYYVSQTVDGCESDRALVSVEIRIQPNATFIASRPYVCEGDTLSFVYYGNGLPTYNYNWQAPLGTILESGAGTQGPVVIRFNKAGTVPIALVVDNGGCLSSRVTLFVEVRSRPLVAVNLPKDGCLGEPIDISLDSADNSIERFSWNFAGGDIVAGTTSGGPYKIVWNTPGTKIITATATTRGCPNIPDGDTIEIHPHPEARIIWDKPQKVCANDSLLLVARQELGSSYSWTPIGLFGATANAATTWARVPKTQTLSLTVTDKWGCTGRDSVRVETGPCCELYVPNAFSPNGDGKNDEFRIVSPGNYAISSFRIVNRYGQVVWSTGTQDRGWDGTTEGEPQPTGTYFYYIRYRCSTGEENEQRGDVVLVR